MIILNFAHPLTESQRRQLEQVTGQPITAVYDIPSQFDHTQPFAEQVSAVINQAPLSPEQWESEPLLINPPGFAPAASALIAELHGRMGYFPALIRIRPLNGSVPPQYEVAEIINLQAVRDHARRRRWNSDAA